MNKLLTLSALAVLSLPVSGAELADKLCTKNPCTEVQTQFIDKFQKVLDEYKIDTRFHNEKGKIIFYNEHVSPMRLGVKGTLEACKMKIEGTKLLIKCKFVDTTPDEFIDQYNKILKDASKQSAIDGEMDIA